MKKIILFLTAFTFFNLNVFCQNNETNIWKRFTRELSDNSIPILPDYSYAGYKLGNEGIPETNNLPTFDVTDYGAIADDTSSDQSAIQAAIDAAEANGGGIVFFPPGEFLVNTDPNNTESIIITKSNIVLKGSSSTPCNGTIINMKNHMNKNDQNRVDSMFRFYAADNTSGSSSDITRNATRGSFTIHVTNASAFQNRKYVKISLDTNDSDVINQYLDNRVPRNIWSRIINEGIALRELHEIESINTSDNTITLKDPIIDDINSSHRWRVQTINLIENCGFEDIHFKANFLEPFEHHKNYIHDNGWNAISMYEVANSWVRRCKFSNVTNVATMGRSYASSMTTLLIDGNAGHGVTGAHYESSRLLQGLIWDNTNTGQYHGPDVSGRVSGCVMWRIDASKSNGYDLHANQPRTNLIDNYQSEGLSGAGGHYSNNPNHLTGLTIWNQERTGSSISNYDWWNIDCNSNYCGTSVAGPIVIGMYGSTTTFKSSSAKYLENIGSKANPESLYEAQYEHRLGNKPAWINEAIDQYNNLKVGWYSQSDGSETAEMSLLTPNSPTQGSQTLSVGESIQIEALITSGSVENVKLYINDTFIRQENSAPYEWGHEDTLDPELKNLQEGIYTIKLLASVSCGNTIEETITITVENSLSISDLIFQNSIQIYPNPVKDVVTIKDKRSSSNLAIKIFDISGRKIIETSSTNYNDNAINIDLSNITPGIYMVAILDKEARETGYKKLIKK